MVQWKALTSFGTTALASTICYCLNFQQGLNRDEIPRAKLISPTEIAGKIKINLFMVIDVSSNYDTKN